MLPNLAPRPSANANPWAPAFDGTAIQTSQDAADFFEVRHAAMIWALYKAPDTSRYAHFEIPKRSGGMRLISSPIGMVRELQYKLLPILQNAYDPHPSSHGFARGRSVVTNAAAHVDQHLVFNIDLEDFFPSINFGRIRGLFMSPLFGLGPAAAAIFAQVCTHRNGLPQGAPTSPVLSNLIATALDRRLTRLAKSNRMRYSRYADDITFSTRAAQLPASIAQFEQADGPKFGVRVGDDLEEAIQACGFRVNAKKVRIQGRHVQQSVTGLPVNTRVNVERRRIRKLRAMLHAWEKFGLDDAGREHFATFRGLPAVARANAVGIKFRNMVYGQLAFVKMVRGADDPVFLKLCARLIALDPNPSKFVRQMIFGAADFEIFISHASEDKAEIARPIFAECERIGLKAFLDEEHIAWGQHFTKKINTALGAARTVLCVVSSTSVTKEWPLAEINAALAMDVSGDKVVVPLMVGNPDLANLPLMRSMKYVVWTGDARAVADRLREVVESQKRKPEPSPPPMPATPPPIAPPARAATPARPVPPATAKRRSWLSALFGSKRA